MPDQEDDRPEESPGSTESRVDKAERRLALRCSFCPPNRKENVKRQPKFGKKKPKKHR